MNPDNIEYGLINKKIGNNELCVNSIIDEFSSSGDRNLERCSDSLNKDWLNSYIAKQCKDKNSCHLDDLTIENMYNKAEGDVSEECDKEAYFFIQYACEVPEEFMEMRKVYGLAAGTIAVFIYLWTIIYFDYIQSV
jgi:hypothetical protein